MTRPSSGSNDLAANDPVSYPKNSAIVAAVGRGEIEVGLVNHYYNYRALAEDPGLASVQPPVRSGRPGRDPHRDRRGDHRRHRTGPTSRTQLIAFLLESPRASEYFADETFEYPLAIGSPDRRRVPPIDFADVGGIDFDELAGGLSAHAS